MIFTKSYRKSILLLFFQILFSPQLLAQQGMVSKYNVLGFFTKSINVQQEIRLSKNFTAALGIRVQPKSKIPFDKKILKRLDPLAIVARDFVNQSRLSGWGLTPEIRYYWQGKAPFGWYVGAFYKYTYYQLDWQYNFLDDQKNIVPVVFRGKMPISTVGLQLGFQTKIYKNLSADFWILGPQYGSVKTDLDAQVDMNQLDVFERRRLHATLEGFAINGHHLDAEVNDNGVKANIKLNIPGIRVGVGIGGFY